MTNSSLIKLATGLLEHWKSLTHAWDRRIRSWISHLDGEKSTILFAFFAVLLPLLWYWRRLLNPTFGMLDDPSDLAYFGSMKNHFWAWIMTDGLHGEPGIGRMRPVYWLFRFFFYYVPAKFNPAGWVLIHYVNLCIVIVASFALIKLLTKNTLTAFLSLALWTLSTNTMSNYLRLATMEVWQLLFLSMLLVCIWQLQSKAPKSERSLLYILSASLLFLLYFTKETTVVLFPAFLVMYLGSLVLKKNPAVWFRLFLMNLVLFCFQRWAAPPAIDYASQYRISWEVIFANSKGYFFDLQWHYAFLLAAAAFSYRAIKMRKSLGAYESWQFLFLMLGVGFFLIFLPWPEYSRRYLIVSDYFFAILMAMEILAWFRLTIPKGVLFTALFTFCAASSSAGSFQLIAETFQAPPMRGTVYGLNWLADHAKKGANVILFEMEMELLHSSIMYTHDYFDRPDITYYSLSPHAERYKKQGMKVVPISSINRNVLDEADYIFWNRRGRDRSYLDDYHKYIFLQLLNSPYKDGLHKIYSDLDTRDAAYPTGVEIWEIKHE